LNAEGILALVASALFCGVLAAWLGGVLFHVRIQRKSYSASRRLTRILVPISADQLVQHMARALNNNPHFIATLTGRMEGVVTAKVRPTRLWRWGYAMNLTARIDDLGNEARVQVRMDFGPLLAQIDKLTRFWIFVGWPLWIVIVTALVVAVVYSGDRPDPWDAMHLIHGAYPALGILVLHGLYRYTRMLLGDSVVSLIENLRFIPRA
jgi:hypothetical protein